MGVGPLLSIRQAVGAGVSWPALDLSRLSVGSAYDWVARCAAADRHRAGLWLPVAFGSGIALYFALPVEPASILGIALPLAAVLLGVAAMGTENPGGRMALACVAAMLLGFGMAKHRTDSVAAPVLRHRLGAVSLEGRIDTVEFRPGSVRIVLTTAHAGHLQPANMPRRVRLSIRSGGETLKPGDWISARANLLPPPDPAEPGDYDFGRAAFFRQIGAVGFTLGRPAIIPASAPASLIDRVRLAIELLRWRMTARIHAVLPGSTGAIAAALITGDRGGISEDDESALRDAGLAHVLAIAGLHMALVGLGLFWLVRAVLALIPAIALTQPIKKWAALAALLGAALYLIISGAATPATRAFIMLAVMLIAILFDRPAISMRSVGLASVIILALRPETLVEPGFQMSFAAVVGLVAVAEWERSRHNGEPDMLPLPSVRRYVRGIAITSFVGSVGTAPFAAFHFDRATHYAVLGNLAAMPVMGFVTMPAAALAVMLMPFGLDAWPLHVMGWGIEAMLTIGRWVSEMPGSVSYLRSWPMTALVLLTFGGLWTALWRQSWRWVGLVLVGIAVMLIATARPPDILVARDGLTVALRGRDGLLRFIRAPADKYSAQEWLKRDGDSRDLAAVVRTPGRAMCDAYGCIAYVRDGIPIATVRKTDALSEDCARNTIVLSAVPTRYRCTAPKLVIDRFDVARNGAYAIWVGDQITAESAYDARGDRPWSRRPQYRRIRPTSLPWTRTRSEP
ncbi:MAG TPA: ComEC/Rec2 family competence protein [Rhizomicrobium sp.]